MFNELGNFLRDSVDRLRRVLDPQRRLRPQPVPIPVRNDSYRVR